jgi:ATP-binding cassette, subfamily B, bacterial PglK
MNLKILWSCLSKRRHRQFYLLLVLMILASLSEVISIGAILPFLGLLSSPEQVFQHPVMQPIIQTFEITDSAQLLLPMAALFIIAALVAGSLRLILLYAMTKLSFATGADLSIDIYRKTLYQEYSVHITRNSSEVINGIILKTNMVINGVIRPTLVFISSALIIIAITLTLFFINSQIAISAITGFGLIYLIVIWFTKQKVKANSASISNNSTQMIRAIQEGLGGIRDVLVDGNQQFYCRLYQNADLPFRQASASNAFVNGSPRYVIESIGMILIAILAYGMSLREGGLDIVIPVLGALALGAQRLLPALQQAYSAYNGMKGTHSSFEDVVSLLAQPLPSYVNQPLLDPITFEKEIKVNNLDFRYTLESPLILNKINLVISKGSITGFVGVTGVGKSTLLDIIMGLLSPTEGELLVDDQVITMENKRSWQTHIAHVPQSIYLSDGTIEENIAFGVPKNQINHQQVIRVAQQAQIAQLIEGWQEKYQTSVGEQGVKLSGGQRQRIGIARALYKQATVLIFDEATSALDTETELAVMEAIKGLESELTILIIAHRVSTLKGCDQVVKLEKNNTIHIGSYEDIINI